MTTTILIHLAIDLVAILALVAGTYFPRHHRRDLFVALLGVNLGVMAVSSVLVSSSVGAGLGLGLFGVLSIIRLRSDELAQHEVAYYFAALAIGLIGGLGSDPVTSAVLMALVVATLWVADHPRLLGGHERQVVVLDRAVSDSAVLTARLENQLGARVLGVQVVKLDLVNDTTTVDVRFRRDRSQTSAEASEASEAARVLESAR
ncbi:DUF4956 domain-containing protein [Propioniciclava sinopodophylli]|jgi:hypothetical protein|uniref:DUF4956 domain-containing protein n=1 Tax=Propioniciclava sinopodophylli TaxID=1837344 RepID=UPI0024932AC5|nr:DUF4956 domain-containing protein [Propioniciclava sinopodophylli]